MGPTSCVAAWAFVLFVLGRGGMGMSSLPLSLHTHAFCSDWTTFFFCAFGANFKCLVEMAIWFSLHLHTLALALAFCLPDWRSMYCSHGQYVPEVEVHRLRLSMSAAFWSL